MNTPTAESIARRLDTLLAKHAAAQADTWATRPSAPASVVDETRDEVDALAEDMRRAKKSKAKAHTTERASRIFTPAELREIRAEVGVTLDMMGRGRNRDTGATGGHKSAAVRAEDRVRPLRVEPAPAMVSEPPGVESPPLPSAPVAGAAPSPPSAAAPAGALDERCDAGDAPVAGVVVDATSFFDALVRHRRADLTVRMSQVVASAGGDYAEVAARLHRRRVIVECSFGGGGGARAGPYGGR